MFYKKTIIMVSVDGNDQKGIVSASYSSGVISGKVKLYNFDKTDGIMVLTFLNEGVVEKCGLTDGGNGEFEFRTEAKIDLEKSVCALVQVKGGKPTPMLIGNCSNSKPSDKEIRIASSIMDMGESELTFDKTKEILDQNDINFDDEEQELIDNLIDENLKKECDLDSDCSKCKYREAFYCEENKENTFNQNSSYYKGISEQLKELFEKCEPEQCLENIIPDSKWVKVDYSNDGNYYVVGLIYDNEELKFVCFGVPGFYASDAPKELEGICKWVPIDSEKPFEYGYWITYQNAETGENVDVEIV